MPVGAELGAEFETQKVELLHIAEVLKRELALCDIRNRHAIALDGLDSLLFEGENQWESLSGLVQAMESLNRHFKDRDRRVFFIAALRSDIYNILPSAESNKFKALAVEFHWSAGGASAASPLWDLVNGKVQVGAPKVKSLVLQYLNRKVKVGRGERLATDYILSYTRYLPRDIIELLSHIAKHSSTPGSITSQAVMDGTKEYCDRYFEGEIFNNLHGVLDRSDQAARKTVAFRDALRTLPGRYFTFSDVVTEVEGILSPNEVTALLRQMFEIGGVGIYNNTADPAFTDFIFRKPGGSGFTKRHRFVLHNALAKAYNRPENRPRPPRTRRRRVG